MEIDHDHEIRTSLDSTHTAPEAMWPVMSRLMKAVDGLLRADSDKRDLEREDEQ